MIDSSHSLFLALEKEKHEPDCTAFWWRHSSGKHSICQNASAKVARGMMGARKPRAKFELRDGKLRYSLNFQLLLGYNFFFPSIFFFPSFFPSRFLHFCFWDKFSCSWEDLEPLLTLLNAGISGMHYHTCLAGIVIYTLYILFIEHASWHRPNYDCVFCWKKSFCQSVIWKKINCLKVRSQTS